MRTLEGVGDGPGLDLGGLLPPHGVARVHQLLADAQLRERRRLGLRLRLRVPLLRVANPLDHLLHRHGYERREVESACARRRGFALRGGGGSGGVAVAGYDGE